MQYEQHYGLHLSRGQGWFQSCNFSNELYKRFKINQANEWNDVAYNYLFCHSFSKGTAEVGNIHSNLSVNTDNKLVDISIKNEYHMNEFYTELWNSSVSCRWLSLLSSLKGCRQEGGQVVVKLTIHVLECMLHVAR